MKLHVALLLLGLVSLSHAVSFVRFGRGAVAVLRDDGEDGDAEPASTDAGSDDGGDSSDAGSDSDSDSSGGSSKGGSSPPSGKGGGGKVIPGVPKYTDSATDKDTHHVQGENDPWLTRKTSFGGGGGGGEEPTDGTDGSDGGGSTGDDSGSTDDGSSGGNAVDAGKV
jgi:hypothetical protein